MNAAINGNAIANLRKAAQAGGISLTTNPMTTELAAQMITSRISQSDIDSVIGSCPGVEWSGEGEE
jgi:hypothetical protein